MEVMDFLTEIKSVLEEISGLLCTNNKNQAFKLLNREIGQIQEYILFLADNQILAIEDINEVSSLLVRSMNEKDSVLLLDVCKYALLDVANQLLEGSGEDEEEV